VLKSGLAVGPLVDSYGVHEDSEDEHYSDCNSGDDDDDYGFVEL
jgi:hypothetical protein